MIFPNMTDVYLLFRTRGVFCFRCEGRPLVRRRLPGGLYAPPDYQDNVAPQGVNTGRNRRHR